MGLLSRIFIEPAQRRAQKRKVKEAYQAAKTAIEMRAAADLASVLDKNPGWSTAQRVNLTEAVLKTEDMYLFKVVFSCLLGNKVNHLFINSSGDAVEGIYINERETLLSRAIRLGTTGNIALWLAKQDNTNVEKSGHYERRVFSVGLEEPTDESYDLPPPKEAAIAKGMNNVAAVIAEKMSRKLDQEAQTLRLAATPSPQ